MGKRVSEAPRNLQFPIFNFQFPISVQVCTASTSQSGTDQDRWHRTSRGRNLQLQGSQGWRDHSSSWYGVYGRGRRGRGRRRRLGKGPILDVASRSALLTSQPRGRRRPIMAACGHSIEASQTLALYG